MYGMTAPRKENGSLILFNSTVTFGFTQLSEYVPLTMPKSHNDQTQAKGK